MLRKRKRCKRCITIVHNEFDYDKLAEAIVKANGEIQKTKENKAKPAEKLSFWKSVWYIIINKKQTDGTMTSGLFSFIIECFFNAVAVIGACALVLGIIILITLIVSFKWTFNLLPSNIFIIISMIIILVLIFLFSLIFKGAANEMSVEQDRDYLVSVFSGVVSFVALIVSLVALFKGVG